jgi:hypothetical protein
MPLWDRPQGPGQWENLKGSILVHSADLSQPEGDNAHCGKCSVDIPEGIGGLSRTW